MNFARPLLAILLAWMLCFQAVAAVSVLQCRHAASSAPDRGSMPHHEHAMPAGQADAMKMSMAPARSDAHGNASVCACGSGCVCAGSCVAGCLAVASGLTPVFLFSPDAPSPHFVPLMSGAGHGPDLYRPPSIS